MPSILSHTPPFLVHRLSLCFCVSLNLLFHFSFSGVSSLLPYCLWSLSCFLVTLSLLSCLSYLLSSSFCVCDLIPLILLYHFSWPAISFSWPAVLSLLACHLVSLTLLSRLSKPAISHLSPCRLTPIPLRTRPFCQDGKVVVKTWSGSWVVRHLGSPIPHYLHLDVSLAVWYSFSFLICVFVFVPVSLCLCFFVLSVRLSVFTCLSLSIYLSNSFSISFLPRPLYLLQIDRYVTVQHKWILSRCILCLRLKTPSESYWPTEASLISLSRMNQTAG